MIHIYPINDLIEHNTESNDCVCNPTIDVENGLVIHDSLDRREVFENKTTKELKMEEQSEQKIETFVGKVHRRQNYAQELFGLSQYHIADNQFGSSFDRVVVERAWCSDVAGYITALQNEVARLTYNAEKMCGGGIQN